MNLLKAIIVDDEPNAVNILEAKILDIDFDVEIVGKANSVREALEIIPVTDFNVLFLDIELRDGTGFGLLEQVGEIDFEVVFTTAYNRYAIEAFKVSAVDYLLKPINSSELADSIQRCYKRINAENEELLENLSKMLNKEKDTGKIALKERGKITFVSKEDILYVKAEGVYSKVMVNNGNEFMISSNLGYFEKLLISASFFRIHRSYLINLHKVSEYLTSDHQVVMENGDHIPASNQALKDFLDIIS